MLADDLFQHVPDLDLDALDHALCALYVVRQSVFDQALHYEGLEQLQRHFLRQTALPHLQRRAYDYNASAGVVDALAQQVLAETTLLTAQQIAQALERAAAGAGHGAAAIINQGIDGFLKHTLFVAHNDVGRAEFEQTLQAVITVNYAAVQIVQVAGGEAAALQLNHRAQFGRNYGYYIQYHPLGLIAAGAEGLDDLQSLYYAGALLTLGLAVALLLGQLVNLLAQLYGQLVQIKALQHLAHSLGAHAYAERAFAELERSFAVFAVGQQLILGQSGFARVQHYVAGKVQHLIQRAGGYIQYHTHAAGYALEIPYVAYGRGQFDMTHALAANLGAGYFNAALIAHDALVAHALVLTAVALPVLSGSENALAVQTVAFRLERTIIYGFGLEHFAVRPLAYFVGRRQANLY